MVRTFGSTHTFGITRREALAAFGVSGASLHLPSLAGSARAATAAVPRRLLVFLTFHSSPYPNWIMRRPGLPEDAAWSFDLGPLSAAEFSEVYAPLWEFRSRLLILDALSNAANMAQPNPQGHHGGPATLLTSSSYDRTNARPVAGGTTIQASGASVDQIIADHIAVPGRHRSLELGTGTLGPYSAIWRGAAAPLPITTDPTKAFARLFPGGVMSRPAPAGTPLTREETIAAAAAALPAFTRERFARLSTRLRAEDRRKLETHRDLLRELELRLGESGQAHVGPGCPDAPPTVGAGATPVKQRVTDFGKLVTAAFACDLTRVASIQLRMMSAADFGGPPGSDVHQDFAHHDDSPEKISWMKVYYRTHAEHLAGLLRQLDAIPETDGKSLLDHTIVLWANECGSWQHQTGHLPLVLAGGGGFRMGRYLHWPSDRPSTRRGDAKARYDRLGPPHSRLLVSIARQFGLDVNQVGDVTTALGMPCTGPLDGLV